MKKIALLLVATVLVGLSGCTGEVSSQSVTYSVSGTASSASLTYQNETGGTQQDANVSLPWSKTYNAKSGDFLYISAQNMGDSGDIKVSISVGGKEFKSSTSTGAASIADANGTCCTP